MKLQNVDPLLSGVVRGLASTWRLDVSGEDVVASLRTSGEPVVFAVWHAFLLAPLWHRRREGITLLVSEHGDGGYLARAAKRWGYEVIRGSSTRGGIKGALGLVRVLQAGGDVALTPDGPTGPPRIPKPGAIAVASRAGAAIVPVGAFASSSWNVGSWDEFSVPKPFSRVRLVYGEPLRPEPGFSPEDQRPIEELALLLEAATAKARF